MADLEDGRLIKSEYLEQGSVGQLVSGRSLIDCAWFSQDVPRDMLESNVATMEQYTNRAHSHVLQTLRATQEAKKDQEEKLYEKQHDLLRLQRGLVLSQ